MKINNLWNALKERWEANPEALFITDGSTDYTFADFEKAVEAIEARLNPEEERIAIIMDHGFWQIASIFAVIKAGKAYVPAEPFFPTARLDFMLKDARAGQLLCSQTKDLEIDQAVISPETIGLKQLKESADSLAQPENLAYILYTSGSTGLPKGVMIRQENVLNYVKAFHNEFENGADDAMLQYSVCSFDIFVEEVFASLLNGTRLVIPPAEIKNDLPALMDYVEKNHVTMISGFPYLLMEMNQLESIPESLRLLISGGDVLRGHYISNLKDHVKIYNTYGPSETTVCASYQRCDNIEPLSDGTYPIGHPVFGVQIEIADENGKPAEPGQTGEIVIMGKGVGSGYTGKREIENRAFHKDPDQIRYFSGDLGYVLPDGTLAFLHRKDEQVMIWGRRVEVSEVENVLDQCRGILNGCVIPYTDENHLSYLAAYIMADEDFEGEESLRQEMKQFLPDYMVPEFILIKGELPMTPNGKIDRRALKKDKPRP